MSNSLEMVKIAKAALADKEAEDIKAIDIQGVSVPVDYFIITNGSDPNQVQAMMDNVEGELGKAGYECRQIEGYGSVGWILMDYGDIIVHALLKEGRLFYGLERIWRDRRLVEESEL